MNPLLGELEAKICDRSAVIGVIGLGYVGLPVACSFASQGFRVLGVDRARERASQIDRGQLPMTGTEPGLAELLAEVARSGSIRAGDDYEPLREADVVTLNVETPVNEHQRPEYEALAQACRSLARVLKRGALVIVESTISPGTTDGLVRRTLEEAGLQLGRDFFLGHCPERVMPGKLLLNLRTMSRVCGGTDADTARVMCELYRWIVEAELDQTDCVTAEIVKTAENAYRDVNIAFANELALICSAVGADFLAVRELVNKSPGRNVLLAGAGVGGHCIPKDPWLLAAADGLDRPLQLIPAARRINDAMPSYIGQLVSRGLAEAGRPLEDARLAIMGWSYLEDSDDTRSSPSAALLAELQRAGAQVVVDDPMVPEYRCALGRASALDAVVFMVAHTAYRNMDLSLLRRRMRTAVLVDGRNMFQPRVVTGAGFRYFGVGRSEVRREWS